MKRKIEFELDTEVHGKKKIVVYEVSPAVILKEIREKASEKNGVPATDLSGLLKHCCSLSSEEVQLLYPSEMEVVWGKFKEANANFFVMYPRIKEGLEKLGVVGFLTEILKELKVLDVVKSYLMQLWSGALKKESAASSKLDIEVPGTMGGDSSQEPLSV